MDNKISVPKNAKSRPLCTIAKEIYSDWGSKVYYGAIPYLQAMLVLNNMDDMYGCDSADTIVLYFLSNATRWRGNTARRIKAELNNMLKGK